MLEYVVLGLLMHKSLTMYEMKKAMEKSTDHFFASSFGSLHPALSKLSKKNWVSFEETLENGRGKKTYAITNEGKVAFLEWLQQDIMPERVREVSLLKLFFLGHLPEESRMFVIRNYVGDINKNLVLLRQTLEPLLALQTASSKQAHMDYQVATLEFGIAYYEFVLEWYKKKFLDLGENND